MGGQKGGQNGRSNEGQNGRAKGRPKGRSKGSPKWEVIGGAKGGDRLSHPGVSPMQHVVVQQFTYKTNKKAKGAMAPFLKYATGSLSKNCIKYCTCSVTKQVATVSWWLIIGLFSCRVGSVQLKTGLHTSLNMGSYNSRTYSMAYLHGECSMSGRSGTRKYIDMC